MSTHTETITTHDIKQGDVIHNYGMRLSVDSEPQQSKAHRVETDDRGATLYVRALILNWDEVQREADAGHSTFQFIRGLVRSDLREGRITEPRWTIQGNGWARWAREA